MNSAAAITTDLKGGTLLRLHRRDLGLNQIEAAEEIGVSHATLRRAEKDEGPLSAKKAKKIADFYGLRPSDIWPHPDGGASPGLTLAFDYGGSRKVEPCTGRPR